MQISAAAGVPTQNHIWPSFLIRDKSTVIIIIIIIIVVVVILAIIIIIIIVIIVKRRGLDERAAGPIVLCVTLSQLQGEWWWCGNRNTNRTAAAPNRPQVCAPQYLRVYIPTACVGN
jgi:hypothetical protein